MDTAECPKNLPENDLSQPGRARDTEARIGSGTGSEDPRTEALNRLAPAGQRSWVLYWMTSARRSTWNFALQRAVHWARKLGKPLLVLETLSSGHRWDTRRRHRFVVEGMRDNVAQFARRSVRYYPFVERQSGDALALAESLAKQACLVVTDDFPVERFLRDTLALAVRADVLVERVDGNGLLPMRLAGRDFPVAFAFRRFLQKVLPDFLLEKPKPDPLLRVSLPELAALPKALLARWPAVPEAWLKDSARMPSDLPIDGRVDSGPLRGGSVAARKTLNEFLDRKLAGYAELRNHPDHNATSGLAPYLHAGHISAHEVVEQIGQKEAWSPARLSERAGGEREGWWGMRPEAEAFLDQLVTWRELGLNMCAERRDYERYESLPAWAQATLSKHSRDPRPVIYEPEQLESAMTHDRLWNAAQNQLAREGLVHNYLRMVWGKKILQWSPTPQTALQTMVELNNKYALDGEDPNSYSGIFWVLGRYDRPWGPERPIFGTIRYMSSENTQRKLRVREYLARYAP